MSKGVSIEDLRKKLHSKTFESIVRRLKIGSKEDALNEIERAIRKSLLEMTKNSKFYQNDEEEKLTYHLKVHLENRGFDLVTDQDHNGHIDLTVYYFDVDQDIEVTWLGEAKISNGPAYLYGGMQQLLTRYSAGCMDRSGGLIIYNRNINIIQTTNNWRNFLNNLDEDDLISLHYDCDKIELLKCGDDVDTHDFETYHIHPKSKLKYRVMHFYANLYHNPSK